MYLHMARGLYYSSFSLNHVWLIGCRILLVIPITISYMWNFGSLLGMCLILQILRGLLLAVSYNCDIGMAFRRVDCFIGESSGSGWLFRSIHSNGARIFFVFMYLHMARGLYYSSFSLNHVWLIGCRILLVIPITISYMWNFGSLLGMCLILQILRKKYLRSRLSKTLWVWV